MENILLEIRWIMEVETGGEIHVATIGLRLWNSKNDELEMYKSYV